MNTSPGLPGSPQATPIDFTTITTALTALITAVVLMSQLITIGGAASSRGQGNGTGAINDPIVFEIPPGARLPYTTNAGGQILINGITVGMTMDQVRTVNPGFPGAPKGRVFDETGGEVLNEYEFNKALYRVSVNDPATVRRVLIPTTPEGLTLGQTVVDAISLYGDPVRAYSSDTGRLYAAFTADSINGTAWIVGVDRVSKKIVSIQLCGCLRQMIDDGRASVDSPSHENTNHPARPTTVNVPSAPTRTKSRPATTSHSPDHEHTGAAHTTANTHG